MRQQGPGCKESVGTDGQAPQLQPAHAADGVGNAIKCVARDASQCLAGRRQHKPGRAALKQHRFHLRFQRAYMSADRARRDMQFLGGAGHRQMTGRGFKGAYGMQWW